jgi:integrase
MASVFKRKTSGKPAKKWSYKFKRADGTWEYGTGGTDKGDTQRIANSLEAQELQVRVGVVKPGEHLARRAATRPLAEHLTDYERALIARGAGDKHIKHTIGVLKRLLKRAGIETLPQLRADPILIGLGAIRQEFSPRTFNHARTAILGWVRWLKDADRIPEIPPGFGRIPKASETVDQKHPRRALTMDEVTKFLATTTTGPDEYLYGQSKSKHQRTAVPGAERAAIYTLALATGLRSSELASLRPEDFNLDSPHPTVSCQAAYTKNKKQAVQPITPDQASCLKVWVERAEPGKPVFRVPDKLGTWVRRDLERAGIPYRTAEGFADAHGLRHTYITELIRSGANPKVVQELARHSTITLTLDRYSHATEAELRQAIEKKAEDKPNP